MSGDTLAFGIFIPLAVLSVAGVYYWISGDVRADDIIQRRPDKDVFYENLSKAPLKERMYYVAWPTRYAKNKPIIKEIEK